MSANVVSNKQPSGDKASGCLGAVIFLVSLIVAVIGTIHVNGFWLCCGMFLTILAGGVIGGLIGGGIGNALRKFACPDLFFTKGGMSGIIRLKLFWMVGPQLIGGGIGWLVGIHLLMMLFWGLPITTLGGVEISPVEGDRPSVKEKIDNAKSNITFLKDMSSADMTTKRNALLMVAIDAGDMTTAQKLIAKGVDVNTPRMPLNSEGMPYKDKTPISPLFAALSFSFDRNEIALLLIRNGADVNERNERFKGPTPLLFVLRNDMDSLVMPLLEQGAAFHVVDVDRKTPLHHTANKNDEKATRFMVERGADITAKDKFNHTPLDYAAPKLKRQMIRWQENWAERQAK